MEKLFQNAMKSVLENGTLEEVVEQQIKESVTEVVKEMFKWNGAGKTAVEKALGDVMVKTIESHDYSQYIVKFDNVLTNLVKELSLDNNTLVNNFDTFAKAKFSEKVTISELSEKYYEFIKSKPGYKLEDLGYEDYVECRVYTSEDYDKPSWGRDDRMRVYFENDHDEDLNFTIDAWKFTDGEEWYISCMQIEELSSLRHMNSFDVFIRALTTSGTRLIADTDEVSEEVHMGDDY